jgi:hypothetical protein
MGRVGPYLLRRWSSSAVFSNYHFSLGDGPPVAELVLVVDGLLADWILPVEITQR